MSTGVHLATAIPSRQLFVALYFLSGAAGLLYEVVWSRLLTLHIGHSVAAVSIVLASFMGGLAVGAVAMGRVARRLTGAHVLRTYAGLELLIAGAAVLVVPVLRGLDPLLAYAYAEDGGRGFGLVRVATSLALVAIPAGIMGASYPVAVRWFASTAAGAGSRAGALYAVNTLGASVGAAVSGFVLIPWLGLHLTTLAGVCLNLIAAAGALWISKGERNSTPTLVGHSASSGYSVVGAEEVARRSRRRSRRADQRAYAPIWIIAASLTLSGFVALILEVAWTRTLVLVLGPTTQAFSLVLCIVIAGLGLGAALAAGLARTSMRPVDGLAFALIAGCGGAVFVVWLVDRIPLALATLVARPQTSFADLMLAEAGMIGGLILPAATALGAVFPLGLMAAVGPAERASRDAAMIFGANAAGAVGGALVGGLLLIPLLGLQLTSVLAAGLVATMGSVLLFASGTSPLRCRLGVGVAAGLGVAGWLLPSWNLEVMSSGAYKYRSQLRLGDVQTELEAGQLAYYKEGATGVVSVRLIGSSTSLSIDGKVDASDTADMLTQKLLAHLPLLLHPDPRDVAVVGLGSGVTLGAALQHPIARADVLEISPEVVEASEWFNDVNGRPLADSRSRLILGDGRTHFRYTSRTYDVIVSEPSNPWMAGLATLFTREFFEAARARLARGGLFCQWAHTYDMSDDDLRSIVATFISVFPEASVWLIGAGDILLIGGEDPLAPQLPRIAHRWGRSGVATDLARAGVHGPFGVLSLFGGEREALSRYASGAVIQTDDHAPLEFSAARNALGGVVNPPTIRAVVSAHARPPAVVAALSSAGVAEWRHRGAMLLDANAPDEARASYAQALELDPHDAEALRGFVRASVGSGHEDEALTLLRRMMAAEPGNVRPRIEASKLLAGRGEFIEAARILGDPGGWPHSSVRTDLLEQAASVFADAADIAGLDWAIRELEEGAGGQAVATFYRATAAYLRGRMDEAADLATRASAHLPEARVYNLLGAAHAATGRTSRARRALLAALDVDPDDAAAHTNLGLLDLEVGDPRAAAARFLEAVAINPGASGAREGLAVSLELLNQPERAARIRRGAGE